MNVRQFAKHVGVSHPAVLKAIDRGRLTRSVSRDARGRVDIDPAEGAVEWAESRSRMPPAGRGTREPVAAPPVDVRLEVTRRLAAIVEADLAEVQRYVLELVPHAVEGAFEALRSTGVEPTTAALAEALRIDPPDEDAALDVSIALQAIVEDGSCGGPAAACARQAGRAAVLGEPSCGEAAPAKEADRGDAS